MILPVFTGIAAGGVMLSYLDDRNLGLAIGLMVLFLVSLEPLRPKLTELAIYYLKALERVLVCLREFLLRLETLRGLLPPYIFCYLNWIRKHLSVLAAFSF